MKTAIKFVAILMILGLALIAMPAGKTQAATLITLYAPQATAIGASATNSDFYYGTAAWSANNNTMEFYIAPATLGLSSFTVDDIDSVVYRTKDGTDGGVDWGFYIYTEGTKYSWYQERLISEPMYSKNYDGALANTWVTWNTADGTDQLAFYDSHYSAMGFYNGPTLADIKAGAIDWSTYGYTSTNIDYGAQNVKYMKFGTGSAWSSTFAGLLDAIDITISDVTYSIDLENLPGIVYVDDDWVGVTAGADPDGSGPATTLGVDAFSSIQEGINAVAVDGTVNVAAGTYPEQAVINKSLKLLGAGAGTIIKAPATLPASSTQDSYIVKVTGSGVSAEIANLTVSGPGPTGCGSMGQGIVVRDSAYAYVHDSQILDVRDSTFSGCQNGIAIQVGRQYWSTTGTAKIENNLISGYQKGGIVVDNTGSDAIITGNTISGAGQTDVTAQNGIQVSRGATATITGNTVSGNSYHLDGNSSDWGAAGILLYQSGNVTLGGGNTLNGNSQNLYFYSTTGTLTVGAENFGAVTGPLTKSYQVTNFSTSPIDLSHVIFEGVNFATATPQQILPFAARIWDGMDDGTSGVALLKAGYWFVDPEGKIQTAIDKATAGDTILAAPGEYTENVNVNKSVTLLGLGENREFSAAIATGDTAAPGVWYTDRYKPAVFESAVFNGEPVLKHGVRAADIQSSSFYNYQGRKLDINLTGSKQTVSIDLWVDPSWTTGSHNVGVWGTGYDGSSVSAYPIIAWRNGGTDPAGFYAFDYVNGGWIPLKVAAPEDYGRWHTLSFSLTVGSGVEHFIDGVSRLNFTDPDTKSWANVILNVYNFGADYDVYWDNFATYDASIVGQMTISASNVKVDGFDMSNPGQAYGIMIDPTVSDIQIMHNRIHDVGGAAVENAKGVYLRMGPDNVTLEGNLFSSIVAGIRSANAIFAGDSNSTDPSTGLVIRNNSFVNITAVKGAYGILLNNGAADTGGGTPGAEIEGNRFSDLLGGWTHAIGLEGPTDGAVVLRNTFSGLNTTGGSPDNVAVFFEDNPVGNTVAVTKNQFLNSGYGVAVAGTYTVNASPNWWGLATGPVATQMGGTLTTSPWCAVPDCSILNPHTVGSEGLQKVLDTAPSYTTIIVPGITYSDGSSIGYHIDTPHLTIILKNGTVIQNNSPCFTVNASYTTITTESIGGAKCIPTGGSNGIDVNAGLVNVILQGMEIDGTGQSTGAGINFAGAIEDVQVLDNNIHNLGGDGLKFNVQPLNVVDIRGNMFKSNTGLGVNNLGTSNIDATYNSWGSQAGPGSGDGVSSHVLYDPWTNVDLFLGSSGTPWAFQVVKNSNISITVMGDLYRVTGASFKLEYDTSLLDLVSATPTALFNAVPPSGTLLNTATDGVVQYDGIKFTEVTGTDMAFYTLVFKGTATGTAYVRFNQATDLFAMSPTSGPSSNIYANTLTPGSVKIITLPTLNSTDIQGYYLTGDRQEFNISLTNPASGGDFSNVIVKYSVSGLQKADIATFEYNAGGTWVAMGSRSTETYLEDSVLNKVYGEFGLAPLGFPIAAGFSDIPQFRVTFNTAGSYPVTLELVDRLASDAVLATFTSTAVVYAKPVITSPNLAGPYLAGIPQAATLNITNPSPIPAPFNLVLALPEGTTVVYNSVTYPCTSSGCIIPVLLPAASNNFPLTITFNAPYSGPVTATLFDSDWTPTVHELAHLTVDPVIAYANFSLKGTISMQGRTLRAGAQMILAGPTGFAYGPFTATSIEQISKNLSWSLIPQATYTLTTYQPRYLNLIAANNKTALVNGALVFNPLELKGGNCVWSDNEIGVGDASCVGGKYGTGTILDDADVNFDGKVNIQDLALVGGNFYATSQTAYGIGNSSIWIPLP